MIAGASLGPAVGQVLPPAQAASDLRRPISFAEDGKRKTNYACRQRMLSQRMAKAACFGALGIDAQAASRERLAALALFERSQASLVKGSSETRLLPETDIPVLERFETVAERWVRYGTAVVAADPAAPEDARKAALAAIYEESVAILNDIDDVVTLLEVKYESSGRLRPWLANAINVAGRQRMLSQKMSKEYCLLASGYEPDRSRALLLGSQALFEASHRDLRARLSRLKLTEKTERALADQFQKVEAIWTPFSAMINRAVGGARPTVEDLAEVARFNLLLLAEIDAVVTLYEHTDSE
jgi:hypothetical protein